MSNFLDRKQFKFYKSYYDIAKQIEDKEIRSDYLMAICEYQFTGIEPDLIGMVNFAFLSQKHSLEKQVKGYNDAIDALKKQKPIEQPLIATPLGGGVPIPIEQPPIEILNNKKEILNSKEEILNNKKEKKENNIVTASPEKFSFFQSLIDYGFDKNLVSDWIKVRKTKKATNTETACKLFISEIEKRSCDINQILEICVEKSWSSFKWTWYDNLNKTNTLNNGRIEKTNREIFDEAINSQAARDFRFS